MTNERLAREFVLQLIDALDCFALGVMKPHQPVRIRHVQCDIHVLVDAQTENVAAVLAVKAGQVGSAASQSYTERRSRYDQR